MRIDKDALRLMQLVDEMKRRRIFVSLIMTPGKTQVSYWDAGLHEIVTTDQHGAEMHVNALIENDCRDLERIARRMGAW